MSDPMTIEPEAWLVDLGGPHALARALPSDLAELRRGGPERLVRRRLLRAGLASRWTVHPDHLAFVRAPSGACRVEGPRPAYISVAQRGPIVFLAASERPIGVDLEPVGAVSPIDLEAVWPIWTALEPTARWTAFEALGKLLSVGAAMSPTVIETLSCTDGALSLRAFGQTVRVITTVQSGQQIAVARFDR